MTLLLIELEICYNVIMKKEEMIIKNIGENIAYYRILNGLTQYELSLKLNYSDKSISKWERGDGIPSVIVLNELALFFNISIDDLVNKNKVRPKDRVQYNPIMYSLLVWLITLLTFSILIFLKVDYKSWHLFILASSATGLIFFIFNLVWQKRLYYYLGFLVFIYGLTVFTHLTFVTKPYIYYIIATSIYGFFSYLFFYISRKK